MDSKSIRYLNTRILVEQVGGVSNFAEKINKGQSQTSQFAGTNPIKGIGNKVAREIEEAFGKAHGWLDQVHEDIDLTKLDNNITAPFPIAGRLVPVISWVQAGTWTTADSIPTGTEFKEWLPPNPKCGKNGYGLIVVGESMSPDFRPSDKIYVNPDFQISDLKTGDLVIVACDGETEATFKKLIVESNGMYLEPLNPKWHEKIIPLREGCKLVGKVVGLYRDV
ncbi:S24 family peptidase [Acinetobacter baumannii]|uniref:LexA family protein n=1 Tax=Acinetobacter baumannii TaxID=470 RepID=UPI000A380F99|nr:S24 family peptidase [Acinetobacter baumannii]MDC4585062.1 S24 family peptidase [Acinetobacter baumannii]MDC4973469.1 S24 family peptidase [Acinetobacter baumannii]MDC5397345.1 S24 family peptidase [Acinetobacter baumannii]MDK2130482.1 S24 family peptidase [Acinetobacter baumannii]MDK2161177.1 S24 family peptidase [Acinetobacter baumannii]